jgi:hypothetical protein
VQFRVAAKAGGLPGPATFRSETMTSPDAPDPAPSPAAAEPAPASAAPAPTGPPSAPSSPRIVPGAAAVPAGGPFTGVRRFIFWCRMVWYLIWNLPGFLNVVSAMKLRKTRVCLIRGYTKSIYLYPLIPAAILLSLLKWLIPEQYGWDFPLGVAYTLLLFLVFMLCNEDVKGRNAVAAIAVVFGVAALYVALLVAGYDVNRWVADAFGFFKPAFNPGAALLLAALISIVVFWSFVRARFCSSIEVQGNQYITIEVHQKTPYPVEEWRLRARVSDWLERIWMGADDLFILSNWGVGRDGDHDRGDAWDSRIQFTLKNVPGARIVEDLVFAAVAVRDVSPTEEMRARM